ncbi:MAG: hypothetical protein CSA76_00735 [Spirochaetales bacterium]|nr:MAG: hypothetical protein CSA76_00735 [Spirochaetales bacterium]
MNKRVLSFLLSVLLLFSACQSVEEGAAKTDSSENVFLSRPAFRSPVFRPLGRVLLSWEPVSEAQGYQLQMSRDENFAAVERSWTIRGQNLELPVEPGIRLYFRIRSFNNSTSSRWSSVLAVNGGAS